MIHRRQISHASLESMAADMRATLDRVADDLHALVAAVTSGGQLAPPALPAAGQPASPAPVRPPTPPASSAPPAPVAARPPESPESPAPPAPPASPAPPEPPEPSAPPALVAARPPEPSAPPILAQRAVAGREHLPQPPAAPPREVVVHCTASVAPAVAPRGTAESGSSSPPAAPDTPPPDGWRGAVAAALGSARAPALPREELVRLIRSAAPAPSPAVAEESGPSLPAAPAPPAGWPVPAAGAVAGPDLQREFQRLAAAQARQYELVLEGLRTLTQTVLSQNQQLECRGLEITRLHSVVSNLRNQR